MSRAQIRRLARLEKQAVPYIARKRREQEARAEALASGREKYFVVVANLAVLILYGDPQVGEPLTCAWRRCVESKAWGRRLPEGAEDHDLELFLGLMRRDRIANEGQDPLLQAHLTPRQHLRALRMKESATTGGSASGSPQARTDDWPDLVQSPRCCVT
jgi:hypothetical protein